MFTGIVEAVGQVKSFKEKENAWVLELKIPLEIADSLNIGDSLACNGCCLTLVSKQNDIVFFELLEETIRLTDFSKVKENALINIERPLRAQDRVGGHFVSGHIDAIGQVEQFEKIGKNFYLKIKCPDEFIKYIVYKGSVAIDGISLTIAQAHDDGLAVWLIPHTLEVTNLKNAKQVGIVNLEFDLLAKYVEKISSGSRDKSMYEPNFEK